MTVPARGRFEGKVALVSGGASGIGAATAARLRAEGCRVVVADIQDEAGRRVAGEIGGRAIRLDVRDAAGWAAAVEDVVATEGRLDIAHLNAGVSVGARDLLALTDDQLRTIVDVNLVGVVLGARAAARAMAAGGAGGALVATASVGGLRPVEQDPIYALTKHGVVGFVRSIAGSLSAHGITIAAVCPGLVETPMTAGFHEVARGAGIPMLHPSEVAATVVEALTSGRTGECWVCLPGRAPHVFAFADLPG